MVTTFLCTYLGKVRPDGFLCVLFINFFGTLIGGADITWVSGIERWVLILGGGGIALLVSAVCWPNSVSVT